MHFYLKKQSNYHTDPYFEIRRRVWFINEARRDPRGSMRRRRISSEMFWLQPLNDQNYPVDKRDGK